MSCSFCGDECHCTTTNEGSYPRFRTAARHDNQIVGATTDSTVRMDSEDYDLSEQQFAASIEAGPQERRDAPRFLPESLVRRSNLQSGLSAERTTAEGSACAEAETGIYVSQNRDPVVEA